MRFFRVDLRSSAVHFPFERRELARKGKNWYTYQQHLYRQDPSRRCSRPRGLRMHQF